MISNQKTTQPASENNKPEDQKLGIEQIISWLLEDHILSQTDLIKCKKHAQVTANRNKHPLKLVAECEIKDQSQLGKLLSLEDLTQWLSKKLKLSYYYFDS